MELVPRLNAEEIRGLFAPPPWGNYLSHLLYVLFVEVMTFRWLPLLFWLRLFALGKQEFNSSIHERLKLCGVLCVHHLLQFKCMGMKGVPFKIYIKSVGHISDIIYYLMLVF